LKSFQIDDLNIPIPIVQGGMGIGISLSGLASDVEMAGDITNGQQARNLFNIGASAIQLGTGFIATKECDASTNFQQAFIRSDIKYIRLIESPVGLLGRAVENEFLLAAERGEKRPKSYKHNCIKSCNPKTTNYCIADALLSAY
jgi:nitronate monooxygenase